MTPANCAETGSEGARTTTGSPLAVPKCAQPGDYQARVRDTVAGEPGREAVGSVVGEEVSEDGLVPVRRGRSEGEPDW